MALATPGRIAPRGPAAERDRLVTPPARLLDQLRPFDFAEPGLGVRPGDAAAFSRVAGVTNTVILLRATNPRSLPYVGQKGFAPKAIDCKAKTAKSDDLIDGCVVECAGLVADPRLLGEKVFGDKAMDFWRQFMRDQTRVATQGGEAFLRGAGKGFYAVDTGKPSTLCRRYGCLMVSDQDLPRDFDPASSHTRRWMARHMRYVHGDYDLYGVVDVPAIDRRNGPQKQFVSSAPLLDIDNLFTSRTHEVQQLLNEAIGCDMVQHGEQVAYKFSADKIYVFAPNGAKWLIVEGKSGKEMAGMLADLFRYVFATEIVPL